MLTKLIDRVKFLGARLINEPFVANLEEANLPPKKEEVVLEEKIPTESLNSNAHTQSPSSQSTKNNEIEAKLQEIITRYFRWKEEILSLEKMGADKMMPLFDQSIPILRRIEIYVHNYPELMDLELLAKIKEIANQQIELVKKFENHFLYKVYIDVFTLEAKTLLSECKKAEQSYPQKARSTAPIPQIIEYEKNKQKTAALISTEKNPLGEGASGKIYLKRNNDNVVVKKTWGDTNALQEFKIGTLVNHPNVVKPLNLYLKTLSNSSIKSKLEMERVSGRESTEFRKETGLSKEEVIKLLGQAKNCSEYLVDNNIQYAHTECNNIFITHELNLKLIDLERWLHYPDNEAFLKAASWMIVYANSLCGALLDTSKTFSSNKDWSRKNELSKKILNPHKLGGENGYSFFKDNAEKMSKEEFKKSLSDYFDEVINEVQINL